MLAPAIPPSARGNARTVARILIGLHSAGAHVQIEELAHATAHLAAQSHYDICHFMHLTQSFAAVQAFGGPLAVPYVLTQTGTDLWPQLCREPAFVRFLCGAQCVAVYQDAARAALLEGYPELSANQVRTVLKAVDLPSVAEALPGHVADFIRDRDVLLLPAHVRPVKAIEVALAEFAKLQSAASAAQRPVVLLVAGEVLDAEYARHLRLDERPGVLRATFARAQMRTAYARATLVLNTSLVESSPNALLEALYLGKPVVAAHIPGVVGLAAVAAANLPAAERALHVDPIAFFGTAPTLPTLDVLLRECLADRTRLARMAASATRAFAYLGDSEREGRSYHALYTEVLASGSRASASLIK